MGLSSDAMNRLGALTVLPLLVGGVALASCSPQDRIDSEGPAVLEGPGVVLLVNGPATSGDDALLEGELILGAGGCAGVVPSWDSSISYLVLWPAGTSLLADGTGLDVPGLGPVEVGEHVALGGGFPMTPRSVPPLIPDVCEIDGEYFSAWTAVSP